MTAIGAGADPLDALCGDRSPVSGLSQVPQAVAVRANVPAQTGWLVDVQITSAALRYRGGTLSALGDALGTAELWSR